MKQTLTMGGYEIYIHGLTDRVDTIGGVVNIADYKTGDSKYSKLKVDEIALLKTDVAYSKAFQLLMYAWLYRGEFGRQAGGMRSGIYWLRNTEGKYEALQKDKSDIIDEPTLQAFENVLSEVLMEMINHEVPFTKTTDIKRCKYCDFKRICGRD